jgi:HSP20 family molecular chaperone IbpA
MFGFHPPRLFIITTDDDTSENPATNQSTSQPNIVSDSALRDLLLLKQQLEDEASGNDTKPNAEEDGVVYRLGRAHVENRKDSYFLTVDLPGVKAADLKIEKSNGKLHIDAERTQGKVKHSKYVQSFAFDERITDFSKTNAVLQDGVLSMTIPKKEREVPKPYSLTINTSEPSTNQDDSKKKYAIFSLDLPGMKASDLKAEFTKECVLHLHGQRKDLHGKVMNEIERLLPLNEKVIDTTALEAVLQDGVLTIMAPCRTSSANRTIEVSTEPAAENSDKPQIEAGESSSSPDQNPPAENKSNTNDEKSTNNEKSTNDETSSAQKQPSDKAKEEKGEWEVVVETAKEDED